MTREDSTTHLTPVVFHTLVALADGPLHGYAITQSVETASEGTVKMGPGTLYGSLQRIQVAGFVERVEAPAGVEGSHADRRRYFEITQAGLAALEREGRRLASAVKVLRSRGLLRTGAGTPQ